MLPSQAINLLRQTIGTRISNAERWILKDDLALDDFENSADGATQLEFSNGLVINIDSNTEMQSLDISEGKAPTFGSSYTKITPTNSLWNQAKNDTIKRIEILFSEHGQKNKTEEFGIEFIFSNGSTLAFEYVDTEDIGDTCLIRQKIEDEYSRRLSIGDDNLGI